MSRLQSSTRTGIAASVTVLAALGCGGIGPDATPAVAPPTPGVPMGQIVVVETIDQERAAWSWQGDTPTNLGWDLRLQADDGFTVTGPQSLAHLGGDTFVFCGAAMDPSLDGGFPGRLKGWAAGCWHVESGHATALDLPGLPRRGMLTPIPTVAADGSWFYVSGRVQLARTLDRPPDPVGPEPVSSASWSPASRRLALATPSLNEQDCTLQVVGAEGAAVDERPIRWCPNAGVWSPDGGHLAFYDTVGLMVWAPDGEARVVHRRQHAEGEDMRVRTWSPDGRYVLVSWLHPDEPGRWMATAIDVQTGDAGRLPFDLDGPAVWIGG